MSDPRIVEIKAPKARWIPVVTSIPHSGTWAPDQIERTWALAHRKSLRNTDWYLPEIYSFLPDLGIHTVAAVFSRYVIDPNRDPSQSLFGDYRTSAVYATNTWGEPMYELEPTEAEAQERVALYHEPYHRAVHETLDRVRSRFGKVLLLDLHSFMGPLDQDICLGNVDGLTSSQEALAQLRASFEKQGFSVAENGVFKGGHIVRKFGSLPATEAIQIELRYTNYLPASELDQPRSPVPDDELIVKAKCRLETAIASWSRFLF